MADQVVLINVRPVVARAPLVLLAALALYCGWAGVRWGIGNTMAETAPASFAKDPAAAFESAEAAVRLAPQDPFTHLMLARLKQYSFDPEAVPQALEEYQRAAELAPNDYLIWVEAGRARGALGDAEGGIRMLRRGAELAPSYAQPRWHLGNALLRAGRNEEAFAELRRATDADPNLRPQVFNLAWQVYAPDLARVADAVGKTPEARGQLVAVLAGRGSVEDAQKVWDGLGPDVRRVQSVAADALARALFAKGQYRRSLTVLSEGGVPGLAVGQFTDGGFESDVDAKGRALFGWNVSQQAGSLVAMDGRNAHGGRRALRVTFSASTQVDFRNVGQVVAVEPGARYRLSFYVKTDEFRSAATLAVMVSEPGAPETIVAASAPAAQGSQNWQPASFEFTAGPKTEAVLVRIVRVACAEGTCPIYGKILYDDFSLERVNGRAPAR
ncbi:MAG: carbohydrate binding domain-containing protein [Acidobacteria bacterium]|nr:carbohydrate binding domain-containing protein [Acidobacteriota bacterium]